MAMSDTTPAATWLAAAAVDAAAGFLVLAAGLWSGDLRLTVFAATIGALACAILFGSVAVPRVRALVRPGVAGLSRGGRA